MTKSVSGLARRIPALAVMLALVVAVTACAGPVPSLSTSTSVPTSSPRAASTPTPVTPAPTATPPAEVDECVGEPMRSVYPGIDPCPTAIAAVRAVAAPLGLPVARMVLQPGPFGCGLDLWPGVTSPTACFGVIIISGTVMHGWVSFAGSTKVAAVSLRLQSWADPSPPPIPVWSATIEAFEVPPAGWVMP